MSITCSVSVQEADWSPNLKIEPLGPGTSKSLVVPGSTIQIDTVNTTNKENAVFRIGMLTDYGTLVLTQIASKPEEWLSAADLATLLDMPRHTVAKVLKILHGSKLLKSRRGKLGGYQLAKPPNEISVMAIFEAFEGRLHVTECSIQTEPCSLFPKCHMARHWRIVNEAIQRTLEDISLEFLLNPEPGGWVGHVGRACNLEQDWSRRVFSKEQGLSCSAENYRKEDENIPHHHADQNFVSDATQASA